MDLISQIVLFVMHRAYAWVSKSMVVFFKASSRASKSSSVLRPEVMIASYNHVS